MYRTWALGTVVHVTGLLAHGRGDRQGLSYLPPGMRNIRKKGEGLWEPPGGGTTSVPLNHPPRVSRAAFEGGDREQTGKCRTGPCKGTVTEILLSQSARKHYHTVSPNYERK